MILCFEFWGVVFTIEKKQHFKRFANKGKKWPVRLSKILFTS